MTASFFITNRRFDPVLGFGPTHALPQTEFDTLQSGVANANGSPDPFVAGSYLGLATPPRSGEAALHETIARFFSQAASEHAVPVVSIHGFNYTFPDAIVRSADLAACYAHSAEHPVRLLPLSLTWPSLGNLFAYAEDKEAARSSAGALARVLSAIEQHATAQGAASPVLFAHSMGAWALGNAVSALASGGVGGLSAAFGQIVVMAGDVDPGSFGAGGLLTALPRLGKFVTIGVNRQDATTNIPARFMGEGSLIANLGPIPGTGLAANLVTVDYSMPCGLSLDLPIPPGDSTWNYVAHNYYRTLPRVREDLAHVFSGKEPLQVPGRKSAVELAATLPGVVPGHLYVLPRVGQLEQLLALAQGGPGGGMG